MEQKLRMYLAELFGTFILVFVGAGTLCAAALPAGDSRYQVVGGVPLAAALAEGFALAVALTATFHVSTGCLNPAITLMQWVTRKLDTQRTFALIGVQLLGAALAGAALRGLFSDDVLREARMGAPHLKALLSEGGVTIGGLLTGAALEAAFTFLVTLAVFATLLDPRAPNLGGVGAGMAQVAVILCGFHLTGGAANPARWFGSAIWELTLALPESARPLADHAVYWGGPIVGAILGGLFYTMVILPPEKK
jgi:aquaporin Z